MVKNLKMKSTAGKFDGEDIIPLIEGVPLAVGINQEDMVLPNPEVYEFYDGIRNRMLYLDNDVESELILEMQKYIISWNREDKDIPIEQRKPIKIMIFSPGGDVISMYNLIDIILLSKTPVYTYNIGMAYSAAFDILLAGHKRYCLPRSRALFHGGSAAFSGTATQVNDQSDNYKKIQKESEDWVLERTKITKAQFSKKKRNEWYFTASEQVEYGIVDTIITDITDLF